MVSLAGDEPVAVPCDEQNGWKLTPQQLAAALTPSTCWPILNSSGSLTGAIYSKQELRVLAVVLADYPQVLAMADDIYKPLRYGDTPFATFTQVVPQMVSHALTANGVSKSHTMAGWCLGYMGGPQWLITAMQIL